MLLEQVALLKIAQSVVARNLNVNRANNELGFAGRINVPKSQTIEPVAPSVGSKVILLGVGVICGLKIEPDALPAT